ncbi:MAG: IclR family transcriptional regulator [Pseudomonadota bacterium]
MTKDYRIASVDKALSVLEALAEQPEQGVSALARHLGMTKSLVFRMLSTLEARGYVAREPRRAVYSLGFRVSVLGERTNRQTALMIAAIPEMEALRDVTSENVNLIVRDGQRSLVVATRDGRHAMRLFAEAGRFGPLHAGGGSTLLLAFAPRTLREQVLANGLPAFTASTETDPQTLAATLDRIRTQRWHIAQNDLDEGAFSVAAPIRGFAGEVVAALSIAGALARFDETRRGAYLAQVRDAADRISSHLGSAY